MFELRDLFWNIGTFCPAYIFCLILLGLPLHYYPLQIPAKFHKSTPPLLPSPNSCQKGLGLYTRSVYPHLVLPSHRGINAPL